MILHKLVMNNFRQFIGHQEIIFSDKYNDSGKNITVLYGENGRGKTGIYRALMYGLYGSQKLTQDDEVKESEINLVNRHIIEDNFDKPVDAYVTIFFTHNESNYEITRGIKGIKNKDGNIIEQNTEAILKIQNSENGTRTYEDPKEILQHINLILDSRVREYFLFDGEKIERLTKASSEQKKIVSAGIRNLLNIDDLEKAIRVSNKLSRELDSEVKEKSTGELQKVIRSIHEIEDAINDHQEKITNIDNEITILLIEKKDIDGKLEQYKEIKDLVEERKDIENKIKEINEELTYLSTDCKTKSAKLSFSIIHDQMTKVYNIVDNQRKSGDIPPLLGSEMIQKLIDSKKCICGRDIVEGTESYDLLVKWLEKTPQSAETDGALRIWKQLGAIIREESDKKREAQDHLVSYANRIDKLNIHESRLEHISGQIGTNEREDAVNLETQRESLEQRHISLLSNQQKCEDDLQDKQKELQELKKEREVLEGDASLRDSLIAKAKITREVSNTLKLIYDDFTLEAASELSRLSTDIMKILLDEESGRNIKEIIVEKDYSLQLKDQWGTHFLANISAGQRQIMSISFITALAKYATGNDYLEMPLFMDTPFGRLSKQHRNNIIDNVPSLSSQWILLATDTELGKDEGQALLDGKKLGFFYRLKSNNDGTTTIIQHSINEVPVLLKSKLGE